MTRNLARHRPLRILMVTGAYPAEYRPHWGTFIKTQVDSLTELGLEVAVIRPKPGPMPWRYLTAVTQVFCKTVTGRYDVVHGQYGLWCLVARIQWTTPVVASFLGTDLLSNSTETDTYTKKDGFVVQVSQWLSNRVDAVIVQSEQMRRLTPSDNVFVIPTGIDFDLFRPLPRAEARAALGWDSDRVFILFGNDPRRPEKGVALAQAAVECLRTRGVPAKLVIANGLPQTTLVQYINASNALLLPSIYEGSPNVVKETMACNVPVVATDVGDVKQVIGRTRGCYVCPRDPEALAVGLEKALRHPGSTSGRADIAHLGRSVIAHQIVAVYEKVMGRSARHDTVPQHVTGSQYVETT